MEHVGLWCCRNQHWEMPRARWPRDGQGSPWATSLHGPWTWGMATDSFRLLKSWVPFFHSCRNGNGSLEVGALGIWCVWGSSRFLMTFLGASICVLLLTPALSLLGKFSFLLHSAFDDKWPHYEQELWSLFSTSPLHHLSFGLNKKRLELSWCCFLWPPLPNPHTRQHLSLCVISMACFSTSRESLGFVVICCLTPSAGLELLGSQSCSY